MLKLEGKNLITQRLFFVKNFLKNFHLFGPFLTRTFKLEKHAVVIRRNYIH